MLLLEQPSSANFINSTLQHSFAADYLDSDFTDFVAEEELKISHSTLEFLASESALFEMFQQEPSSNSQLSSTAVTENSMSGPLAINTTTAAATSESSSPHMDIQLPSFEETYSPSGFGRDCPDGSDYSFKFEELIATSPDMPSSSNSLQNDFVVGTQGFPKPRRSVPCYSSDNTSFSSGSSVASYSGDATPPPPVTPPCVLPSPTWSRRSSLASSMSSSPLRETATPSRRGSTPSPASSVSGPIVSQKKKSAGSLLCAVCGDSAACQHYGVRTCEGCKGFFKRTVQKDRKYSCPYEKKCIVEKVHRNRCQYCRYQKCLVVGMDKEVVRTDNLKGRRGRLPSKPKMASIPSKNADHHSMRPSSPQDLVSQIVQAHHETWPDMNNRNMKLFRKVERTEGNLPRTPAEVQQFYEVLSSSMTVIRAFVEKVPGFHSLLPEDRELLFTSACLELLALRLAFRMMSTDHSEVTFCNGVVLHRSQVDRGFGKWLNYISDFSKSLEQLQLDHSSLACFAALVVTTHRPGLSEPSQVEALQMSIIDQNRHYFSRLLARIPDLHTLSVQGQQGILYLKLEELVPAPPLIESIFAANLPF